MREDGLDVRFLMGNHEEVFLRALEGDLRALRFLIRIGGRETLLSYGISEEDYRSLDFDELAALADREGARRASRLPRRLRGLDRARRLSVRPCRAQAGRRASRSRRHSDLCWIRDDFLRHRDSFGKMVVHGHSITEEIDVRANRIGIDTGAFASGRLTAIGLEGEERWFLST